MFKTTISFLFVLLSISLMASEEYPQTCITHGECQKSLGTVTSPMCLIVNTGTNASGEVTCTVRCISAVAGSYCDKPDDYQYGFCMRETFDMPNFDPSNPDCSRAVEL